MTFVFMRWDYEAQTAHLATEVLHTHCCTALLRALGPQGARCPITVAQLQLIARSFISTRCLLAQFWAEQCENWSP
jgi:hypothetical protein